MASSNQVELVVTVEVDKANQSIKSVNANLSSIESTAAKSARGAAAGIDGMTAAMVKGATAGNLLADAIKTALRWVKEFTIDAVKDAAHVERLEQATLALAKSHGVSAEAVRKTSQAIQDLNLEDEVALRTINRLIVADMGFDKAEGLAKLAKDAAILDENLTAPEALEGILRAIEFGQERALKQLGIKVQFDKEIELAELKLGRTLSENEKVQIRYNAVMQSGADIHGASAAAAGLAESQMKKLEQEIRDLRKEIGKEFVDEFRAIIQALRDLVKWLGENTDLLKKFAQGILVVGAALATYKIVTMIMGITEAVKGLTAAMVAGRLATVANPMALLITGGIAAGAIIYNQYTDLVEQNERRFKEMEEMALRQDLLSGKLKVEDLKKARGMTDAQVRELVLGSRRRLIPGMEEEGGLDFSDFQYKGPKVTIGGPAKKEDLDKEIARLKLAKEMGAFQRKAEKDAIDSAAQARAKALPEFAGEIAELNNKIRKWTTFTDDKGVEHQVRLTRKAWDAVIDELSTKWKTFKEKLDKDNREAIADYVKAEEEAAHRRMELESELFQKRLQYNEEIAQQNLDHVKELMQVQEQRAGIERDARLRTLEGYDARTIEQKVWVEQQKAQIEIDYVEQVHEMKQRLFDLETSQRVMDYDLEMKRLGYRADEIQARIAEYTQQREAIRQANQEATDASVDAARQNAANRTADLIREHNQRIFDSLKRQAEGVFDALVTKSQSVWSAIGNSFKTAMLTAIKEVVTSQVARALMGLFGGTRGHAPAGAGGGGLASVLGGIGIFGGGGGGIFAGGGGGGIPGAGWPGGTPPFVPSGIGGGGGAGGILPGPNWAASLANLKSFAGIGGSIQLAPGVATTWQAATMGQKLSSIGKSNAALLGGGLLVYEGLRRGGAAGVGMSAAGGALIGFKYGGPLGALIGGIAGAAAGVVRLFIKGAQEKAREKIKAVYGVDISDKGILKQIVDMAKSAYGGNLDVAIQSQQVRELVELYAMSTGQTFGGQSTQVRPVSISQSGGSLFQTTGYSNGAPLSSLGGLPSLDAIGRGAPSGGGMVVNITVPGAKEFFEKETVRVVVENPRAVQSATMTATKQNAGRREMAALQTGVGLVTS
ncbi:MAG: hypothetical protein LC126_09300 [Bryobacterales bacterium]|nr:hypothetical protein [Bryobacterales bacterium]